MSETNEVTIKNEAALQMQKTNNVADVCRGIVTSTAIQIQGKKYVPVEAWQSIATAHGCVAGSEAPIYLKDVPEKGYQAKGYITHIATGKVISTAFGFVGDDEVQWANRPAYARQAMAQTRAISRACRSAFAHVIVLMNEGLECTPFEEVPKGGFNDKENYNPSNAKAHEKDIVNNLPDGHWAGVVIPFGKNKGRTIGELAPNSVKWYFENYEPKEYPKGSGQISERDKALRDALNEWGKENGLEAPVFERVVADEVIELPTAEELGVVDSANEKDEIPF